PEVTVDELADAIGVDGALAGRILKTANSPLYAQSRSVVRLRDAVRILGLRTVKTLALGFSLVDQFRRGAGPGFDHRLFWERNLFTAVAARAIATKARLPEPESAFMGGLMHGLGILVLEQAIGPAYATWYTEARGDVGALRVTE